MKIRLPLSAGEQVTDADSALVRKAGCRGIVACVKRVFIDSVTTTWPSGGHDKRVRPVAVPAGTTNATGRRGLP